MTQVPYGVYRFILDTFRPNIYLKYISKSAMDMETELNPYIDELREKGVEAKKCIIYTGV